MACLLALSLSLIISRLVDKILDTNKFLTYCSLNTSITINDVVLSVITYFPSFISMMPVFTTVKGQKVLSYHQYRNMPMLHPNYDPFYLQDQAHGNYLDLKNMAPKIQKLRRLEVVTGAIERDSSDPKHRALSDVFREHIRDTKREVKDKLIQGYESAMIYDYNVEAASHVHYAHNRLENVPNDYELYMKSLRTTLAKDFYETPKFMNMIKE